MLFCYLIFRGINVAVYIIWLLINIVFLAIVRYLNLFVNEVSILKSIVTTLANQKHSFGFSLGLVERAES